MHYIFLHLISFFFSFSFLFLFRLVLGAWCLADAFQDALRRLFISFLLLNFFRSFPSCWGLIGVGVLDHLRSSPFPSSLWYLLSVSSSPSLALFTSWVPAFSNISFAWPVATSLNDYRPQSSLGNWLSWPIWIWVSPFICLFNDLATSKPKMRTKTAYPRQISLFSSLVGLRENNTPRRRYFSNVLPTLWPVPFSSNILLTRLSPFNPQFGPSLYRLSTVDPSSFHAVPNLHLDASTPVILAQFFRSMCISMHCPIIFPFELCVIGVGGRWCNIASRVTLQLYITRIACILQHTGDFSLDVFPELLIGSGKGNRRRQPVHKCLIFVSFCTN